MNKHSDPKSEKCQARAIFRRARILTVLSGVIAVALWLFPIPAGAQTGIDTSNIMELSGWLQTIALATCVGGIFVSAALWGIGSKGQNPGQELTGKRGIILCCTAAFLIGALPSLIGYFDKIAKEGDTTGITGGGIQLNCTQGNGNTASDRWQNLCNELNN